MISRQTSSLFASLLVLTQLLVSPLAHSSLTAHDGCGDTGQTTHATATAMTDCGDCPDGQATTRHCERLVKSYTDAAADYRALAVEHHSMAKDAAK